MLIHNDEANPYFETVKPKTSYKDDGFKIRWNVKSIAGKENANGFIVQLVDAEGPKTSDEPYYEAWRVENGKTDHLYDHDDVFRSKDQVKYHTQVFWIDETDELYQKVTKWEPTMMFFAGDLPAVLKSEAPYMKDRDPLFEREYIPERWN